MSIEILNILFGIDLPVSGGNGDTIEDSIKIELTEQNDYIRIEKEVIKWICDLRGYYN